jgi:hypothetical protein
MNQNCKSVFLYDKEDNLITFSEINNEGELINYYDLKDRKLQKLNTHSYKEKGKNYIERNRAIVVFEEDCSLFHTFIDGESRVVAQKKNAPLGSIPKSQSKLYSLNEDNIESFTINPNLVQNWLKKL